MNKTFGYSRVSTSKQLSDSQIELLNEAGCDETFIEVQSGAHRKRPQLEKLLAMLGEGDTFLVVKLDRLSRSLHDLLSIAQEIEKKGAHLRSLQDPLIDTTSPNGKLIFGIFAVLAEYERDLIRARTLDGLAAARARGKILGRREALNQEQKDLLIELRQCGQSLRQLAETFGVSKTTISRYLRLADIP
ncbi:MAG: recombinase family protein [Gammaproteobacteria bacterium]|nr:recombinase family protein [Gammaproteobacteria bacterium]MYF02722.1 recombinase family protein [Gammaproteobacteria bacterium]MYI76280.1 recombinase family protein [Gammaproteobacteria bacterium]